MAYKQFSCKFEDRENLNSQVRTYLEKQGFTQIGDNNHTKATFGSRRGTVTVDKDILNFETRIDVGTTDESLLEELTTEFQVLKFK